MSRLATIFLAFAAISASACADTAFAASAQDAIKAWIAAVPGTDWKIAYKNLTYDMASDRTTLTGLTATSQSLQLTVGVDSVAITGYAATSGGGFSGAALAVGTATISSNKAKAKITIAGISAKDFGSDAMAPVAFDKDHPFTSIVQAYADLLKVHLGHGGIASISYAGTANDPKLTATNFAIDNWAGGKISSMTTGAIDIASADGASNPGSVHLGGFESHDTDLGAVVHVYDPAQYVNGAGDGVWQEALGSASYHDFSVKCPDFNFTLGAWTIQDVKMRQPAHNFSQVLDQAAKSSGQNPGTTALQPAFDVCGSGDNGGGTTPDDSQDLGPDGVHALMDMWSAFSLGKFSVTDVAVDSDGGSGKLGAFTIADLSSDGLGEISIDNLDSTFEGGFAKIGRLAAGNFVFPGVDKLSAAYDASQKGEDVDYASLSAKLGYVEAAAIDVETPLSPETKLDKARLDLNNYVGVVPTTMALSVNGFDAPVQLFDEAGADSSLSDLGYDRVHLDAGMNVAWNEKDQTVTIDGLNVSLANVGNFSGKVVLGGLTRDALSNVNTLPEALEGLNFVSSSMTIEDKSIFSRWLAQQAFQMGIDQEAYRKQLLGQIPDVLSDLDDGPFKTKLVGALTTFITAPGTFTVTANPAMPQPAAGLAVTASLFPDMVPALLGLDVTAVAGPAPVPYNYVPSAPPPDQTPPDQTPPGGDYRHVPEKKS